MPGSGCLPSAGSLHVHLSLGVNLPLYIRGRRARPTIRSSICALLSQFAPPRCSDDKFSRRYIQLMVYFGGLTTKIHYFPVQYFYSYSMMFVVS